MLGDLQISRFVSAKPLASSLALLDSHLESFLRARELLYAQRRKMLPVFLHYSLLPPLVFHAGWQLLLHLGEVSPLFALLFHQTDFFFFFFLISSFALRLPRRQYIRRARWREELPGAQVWIAYVSSQ